jgi:hypothetical protein
MRSSVKISFKGKKTYAIIVDGQTEFWYFQMLLRNNRSLSVHLKPEIPQKKKLVDQFEIVKENAKHYDKVIWIVDLDVIVAENNKTKKGEKPILIQFRDYCEELKKNRNVTVLVNNPCFEYWLLLHFESTTKFFSKCDDAIKQLKKHLPYYAKTSKFYTKEDNDIYLILKFRLKNAIANAKKTGSFSFDNPHTGICEMFNFFTLDQIKEIV